MLILNKPVSLIQSDFPFKDWDTRFSTVPMIYNQLKKVLDNVDFLTQNVFNSVNFAIGFYKQVMYVQVTFAGKLK